MADEKKSLPTFKPMPGKIVAQVIGERGVYGSGLLIKPATVRNPRTTAVVIAVYEPFLVNNEETEAYVQVGDKILFGMHSGIEIEYGDEKVIILREQEILTKVVTDGDMSEAGVVSNTDGFDDLEG